MRFLSLLFFVTIYYSGCSYHPIDKNDLEHNNVLNSKNTWTMYKSVKYEVGNPNFRGRTTVEILRDKEVHVLHVQGENSEKYKGLLDDGEFSKIMDTLSETRPCTFNDGGRLGKPGEVKVKFTITTESDECSSEVWLNEQWENSNMRKVVGIFEELAKSYAK